MLRWASEPQVTEWECHRAELLTVGGGWWGALENGVVCSNRNGSLWFLVVWVGGYVSKTCTSKYVCGRV